MSRSDPAREGSRGTDAGPQRPEAVVRGLIRDIYGEATSTATRAFVKGGMNAVELVRLYELVRESGCRSALEVGMGSGTSSLVICRALRDNGGGMLTSIDPFQSADFGSAGIRGLEKAGLAHLHRLIERPDYLALPDLLAEGKMFDFIFIDGWHSFDYAFVDMFYSDLLLADGGVLAFHDTSWPTVYKATRFLETHKPYRRLSPPPMVEVGSVLGRGLMKLGVICSGPAAIAQARARRQDWLSVAAYRKVESRQVHETTHHPF